MLTFSLLCLSGFLLFNSDLSSFLFSVATTFLSLTCAEQPLYTGATASSSFFFSLTNDLTFLCITPFKMVNSGLITSSICLIISLHSLSFLCSCLIFTISGVLYIKPKQGTNITSGSSFTKSCSFGNGATGALDNVSATIFSFPLMNLILSKYSDNLAPHLANLQFVSFDL